ncbi:MAG: hypothetical protein AAFV71_19620 [Cyanobacteria bacterium J06633_8]
MADRKTKAKRSVAARKRTSTKTTNTTKTTGNYSTSSSNIELPILNQGELNNDKPVEVNTVIGGGVTYDKSGKSSVEVPNIQTVDINSIGGSVRFPDLTPIDDITKPNITNKCDEKTKNAAIAEYDQGINYELVAQKYNNYTAERYKTLVSAYKSYAEGLKSVSELEKVKQQFVEVLKQQSVTQDKITQYIDQAHKTATGQAKLPYSIAEREAGLNETKSKAKKAFYKAQNAEDEALAFINGVDNSTANTSSTTK